MLSWIVTVIIGAAAGYFLGSRVGDREKGVIYALVGAVALVFVRLVLWLLNLLVFGALFAALGVIGVIIRIALELVLGLVLIYFIIRLARKIL